MNRKRMLYKDRRSRAKEQGSVLIPVLAVIISCTMIVGALLALSRLGTCDMTAHVQLQKASYLCEGAANRIQWLLTAERARHAETSLRDFDYGDYDYERFLPDGVEHTMDYHGTPVKFILTDAAAGLDFSHIWRRQTLRSLQADPSGDEVYLDQMSTLEDMLADYTDSNDTETEDGWEEADYENAARKPLPRNGMLQYREELFWIPGFTELFPPDQYGRLSAIRIIPPASMAMVQTTTQNQGGQNQRQRTQSTSLLTQKPNLFGAGDHYLKNVCQLEESELKQIHEAIRLYQTERIPFQESLDSTLLVKIGSAVNWNAGKTVTAIIDPSGNGIPARRLAVTWTIPDNASGPENGVIRWLEWMLF